MFSEYDYVWMGHVHKPQVLSKSPYIAHVGSMDRSDVGESDHKKIIIYFDPAMDGCFTEIEIPVRPLEKITIQIPADTTDTTEYVLKTIQDGKIDLKNGIVKLEVQLLSQNLHSVDRKAVEAYLQTAGVYHIASFSETKKISLLKKKNDSISHVMTESNAIREWSKKFVEEKNRDKFIALAEEIRQEMNMKDKS
jgi:DNA repair exonuclease SbcCD nuclease subunit